MTTTSASPTTAHPPTEIEWVGGLKFDASRDGGPNVRIDGDYQTAPSPFDMLLAAIATCAATDVVTIMEKQRTPLQGLHIQVEAQRISGTPKRLAAAILHFELRGNGITAEKAARAVELSVTKYCSVRSSLIEDAPVTWTIDIKT